MTFAISISFALLLMLSSVMPVTGENERKELSAPSERNRQVDKDEQREREIACNCCKACREARKEIRGKEEGPPAKDGCRDCCRRCGPTQLPDQRKMPPEIVK